jgi:hypothetical protein
MDPIGQLVDDNEIFNTESNWYAGAFNSTADPTDPFDIGWAVYTMMGSGAYPAHSIIGDSLYYVETPEGTYRLWLKYRIPGGIYSLTYQSEDVGTPNTITFDLDDYADASTNPARKKNFIYVNFNTGQVVDREPYSDEWDLLFTRYLAPQPNGTLYPVSGVKLNVNRQVAEFAHIDVNSIDTTGASWSLDATYIGSDWKAFNGQQFVITDSLCWAVKAHDGSVWVLYFDYFPGSGSGAYGLQKRQLAVVGSPGTLGSPRIGIFPNPATTSLHLVVDAHAPAQGSLEIRDMSGRVVYSAAVHLPGGLVPITLMGLDIVPGVYSLVLTANGQCVSQRVVFQR